MSDLLFGVYGFAFSCALTFGVRRRNATLSGKPDIDAFLRQVVLVMPVATFFFLILAIRRA
jgi:hypothetical protein